ncbi:MAG TPA: M23 family metallopeptidase [Spirochaetota bacterium]|nr:M23 family metallopeptidase [Spirochaetota bacterium]
MIAFLAIIAVATGLPDVPGHVSLYAAKKRHSKSRKPVPQKIEEKIVTGTKTITLGDATRAIIPLNFAVSAPEKLEFAGDDFIIHVYAKRFAQGNAAYMEVRPHPGENLPRRLSLRAAFEGTELILTKLQWGYRGLFALPPDLKPGIAMLEVSSRGGRSDRTYRYPLKVHPTRFETYRSRLHLGKYSDRDLFKKHPELVEKYAREKKKKEEVFARVGTDAIKNAVSHPRDYHRVTSSFYAKRIYDRYYLKNRKKIRVKARVSHHQGLDLFGRTGAPIYAVADGTVVIAEEMHYEGNHTVIDHGAGVFSRYMHQSEILVKAGQKVKAGDLVGKVGDTGMVTGPHLHVGLAIRGIPVDPVSLLWLPISGE